MLHRDSQKRYYIQGAIYFVTFNTKDWFPFFREPLFCDLLVEELRLCKKLKQFKLYGFVVMPDHVHALIQPADEETISSIMHWIKRNSSRNVNRILQNEVLNVKDRFRLHAAPCLSEGADDHPRLQSGTTPRAITNERLSIVNEFIPLFEQKFESIKNQFHREHPNPSLHFPKFQWQKSYHDHVIRDERDFHNHLEYIWFNPVKDGLTPDLQHYPFVSFSHKFTGLVDNYYIL
jgi:REP element-mobilizing transposase RayT